jgi:hypothetical protein
MFIEHLGVDLETDPCRSDTTLVICYSVAVMATLDYVPNDVDDHTSSSISLRFQRMICSYIIITIREYRIFSA